MLDALIEQGKRRWLRQPDCPILGIMDYARARGKLRDAQLDAIETYLFLKIAGQSQLLWTLIAEGLFTLEDDLNALAIPQALRDVLNANTALRGLYDLARQPLATGKPRMPALEQAIKTAHETLDAQVILKRLFYDIDYSDYLFSLPMGAGKTWLMAAFMCLDLHFSEQEPDNPAFARNFLILIPSGLKSSLIPSLRTLRHFDPAWIVPEPSAGQIRKRLHFEILDQGKAAAKSNQTRNLNAQKVNSLLRDAEEGGRVFVVNAEKVILDRLDMDAQQHLIERNDDDKDRQANELRNILGKLPHMQIMVDEVHHAATSDIKLRQVIGRWSKNGNVAAVLGFSGTPYLSKPEIIPLGDKLDYKSAQISNTVFYYPLVRAVRRFLKKPRVEQARGLSSAEIVERGVRDFLQSHGQQCYADGAIAKLAIYCGNIERLEEDIYPQLLRMGIPADDILKFHRGNTKHKLPKANEAEFAALDSPQSRKKIILLVQVGKEGWDCRSLTGVILAQKGDCPPNMVLQTACRCLRQMDGGTESALIWLNEDNAKTLDKQLKDEQHTSIAEISRPQGEQDNRLPRTSRMAYLRLPAVRFYQMRLQTSIAHQAPPALEQGIAVIQPEQHLQSLAEITSRRLDNDQSLIRHETREEIKPDFEIWLARISKGGFNTPRLCDLAPHRARLLALHEKLQPGTHDLTGIEHRIRLAFHARRTLQVIDELIEESARLLLDDKLNPIEPHPLLYPNAQECKSILELDASHAPLHADETELIKAHCVVVESLTAQGMGAFAPRLDDFLASHRHSDTVQSKDRSFHYLPYDFRQSGFEKTFMEQVLKLQIVHELGLELYFNGERHLTEFRIQCYQQQPYGWRRVGAYTPDFLLIQRKDGQRKDGELCKVLIVETKGEGFAEQSEFKLRRQFVEEHFIRFNNLHFGARRFDYLFLQDNEPTWLQTLSGKIQTFFPEA